MKQLNSLISALKSKLKRGKDEDEDEYEDEEEEVEAGEATESTDISQKSKKSKSKKSTAEDDEDEDEDGEDDEDEDDEDDEDEEEAKKKKRVKILGAAFAALLLFVVVDEMFLKTDEGADNAAPEVTGGFVRPPKRKRSKPAPTAEAQSEAEATSAPIAEEGTPPPDIGAPEIPEIEEEVAREAETPAPEATAPVIAQESEASPEESSDETSGSIEENPFMSETAPEIGESEVTELQIPDSSEEGLPSPEAASAMEEMVASEIKKEYVEPPKYDQIGRGLVYNCQGKHWACVDKNAYFQCKDNYLHNNSESKSIECYPSEVYATYDDCKVVQIHHINMVKEIDFCGQ